MRRHCAIITLVAITPLATLVGWWLMPEPRVTAVNCERIRDGMTRGEVEAILGDCPRYEEQNDNVFGTWEESGRMIVVVFSDGRAWYARYVESTLWERLESWYHGEGLFPLGGKAKRLEAAA